MSPDACPLCGARGWWNWREYERHVGGCWLIVDGLERALLGIGAQA